MALPPFVAHHHYRTAARLIFLGQERAAQERSRAERLKETWRDNPGPKSFRFGFAGEEMAPRLGHTEFIEGLALLLPIEKIGRRSFFALNAAFGSGLPDGDDAIIVLVRQRP